MRLADDEHLLGLTVHHIAADGWSLAILARELGALWEAAAEGRPAALPEPRLTFVDFALWQARRVDDLFPRQLDYWRTKLAGLRPFTLPPDHPPADDARVGLSFDVAEVRHRVGDATAAAIAARCAAAGTTPYVVLFAAVALALGRRAGDGDVRLSTLVANRDRPGTEEIVGNLLNTLIVRSQLDLRAPFDDALARVRADLSQALAHQDLPLELLLDALDAGLPRPELARIQVMNRPQLGRARQLGSGGQSELLGAPPPTFTTFDLLIELDADLRGAELTIRYRRERYERATLDGLLGDVEALVVES